jgi:hypothetical protein
LIDGSPIVVIVNKIDGSDNAKTGAMVQTFIIRSDIAPVAALQSGADYAICGDCEHRPILAKKPARRRVMSTSAGRSDRFTKHISAAGMNAPAPTLSRALFPVYS